MSANSPVPEAGRVPGEDHEVTLLEFDETIPPRPEEEFADASRAEVSGFDEEPDGGAQVS